MRRIVHVLVNTSSKLACSPIIPRRYAPAPTAQTNPHTARAIGGTPAHLHPKDEACGSMPRPLQRRREWVGRREDRSYGVHAHRSTNRCMSTEEFIRTGSLKTDPSRYLGASSASRTRRSCTLSAEPAPPQASGLLLRIADQTLDMTGSQPPHVVPRPPRTVGRHGCEFAGRQRAIRSARACPQAGARQCRSRGG